jgi:RHS repeat-associated protein
MFDCAGNLVRKQDGVHDLALRWDATGQLVEAMNARPASEEQPGIHDFDHIHAQYEYDAFQRRVRKIVHVRQGPDAVASDAGAAPLSRVCRFFWDGDVLAADYTVDHRVARSCRSESERTRAMPSFREAREWICYPGTFVPLAAVYCALPWPERDERGADRNHAEREANAARPVPPDEGVAARPLAGPGALYFYENAPNGAPMRMVDGDGNVVWGACYSALGGIVLREVCEIDQPIRLQGQYFDEESGISYNRHRYFDPHAGSFISQDPIGLAGGTDLYQFAPNPFRWADPRGLRLISVRAKLIVGNWTSGFYHSVPGEVHAEQGGLLENLNRVANHDIGFANIEGTVNRSDWFPVPICT